MLQRHSKRTWRLIRQLWPTAQFPVKYKELMALSVAFTTQCPYCIDIHSRGARAAGATEAEIAETVCVTAALRAGAAITHGTHAMK